MGKKKFLYITHLSGKRVNRLWLSALKATQELDFEVHLACNMAEIEEKGWNEDCKRYQLTAHQIDFNRNPFNWVNIKAARQLLKLIEQEKFDVVHCNTPIGGVVGRLCARKAKIPYVIYQAHGFHFWKGAPIINWLLYYPVERFFAHYTDILITINKEDYVRAQKFKAKKVCYVPGVGIDIKKFSHTLLSEEEKEKIRSSLGVMPKDKMLLSVGELITRKNHEEAIRAVAKLADPTIKYFICGSGELESHLIQLIQEQGAKDSIKLLGYRTDISELLDCTDLFIFPSKQEGLPVALMEAIASKTAVLCSNIRGNRELVGADSLFELGNTDELSNRIRKKTISNNDTSIIKNYEILQEYDVDVVREEMKRIYAESCLRE